MAAKIKSGDLVKVIRGKDRGKEGTVKQVLSNDRLIVEGVQIVKKHVRATQQGQQAGIVSTEAPIHRSNVMVIDPETKQPTRVGITVKEEARDGKVKTVRVRVAKKSGKELSIPFPARIRKPYLCKQTKGLSMLQLKRNDLLIGFTISVLLSIFVNFALLMRKYEFETGNPY